MQSAAAQQDNNLVRGKCSTPAWPLTDEDGFLVLSESWTPAFAENVARSEGITELTEKHWSVLNFLRDYYESFGGVPSMRRVCRSQQLTHANVSQMFNSCLSAWRMAGLPYPGEEAKSYMG